jgi:hypothetical protein
VLQGVQWTKETANMTILSQNSLIIYTKYDYGGMKKEAIVA